MYEEIRILRELHHYSQEEMAEKLNISINSYANIERGKTKLTLEKLEKIATVFNMEAIDLLTTIKEKKIIFFNNENANIYGRNYHSSAQESEIEKLQLIINHKEEIITQKNAEIAALKEVIALLKK